MKKRKGSVISLDNVFNINDDLSDKSYNDILPDTKSDILDLEFYETLKSYLAKLSEKDQELIKLSILGYTQKQIADKLNISQPTVSRKQTLLYQYLKER